MFIYLYYILSLSLTHSPSPSLPLSPDLPERYGIQIYSSVDKTVRMVVMRVGSAGGVSPFVAMVIYTSATSSAPLPVLLQIGFRV